MTLSHNENILSIFQHENEFWQAGYDAVIGIDEAGRGPLAGPVVACAVAWGKSEIRNPKSETNSKYKILNSKKYELIRDSKKLSEKQRESLYDFILENFHVGVGICDHSTIDRINVLEATWLAMKKALSDLNKNLKNCHSRAGGNPVQRLNDVRLDSRLHGNDKNACIILVDGNKTIPNLSMEQKAIVGGDKIVKSISAASIVAKVTRDRIMREMAEKFPEYGFLKHKGYGTVEHLQALKKHGPCEIHRKSFEPIKSWTKQDKRC